jgi:uncharacterized membrane protein YoaK (UPF0700 family)
MAMGMQNAMTTKFSGAVIRTTHITGLTTDMGIVTANWLQGCAWLRHALIYWLTMFRLSLDQ